MPFVSRAQQRKCYALKARGQAGSWDCDEWSEKTDFDKLPERKRKSRTEKQASRYLRKLLEQQLLKEAGRKQAYWWNTVRSGLQLARSMGPRALSWARSAAPAVASAVKAKMQNIPGAVRSLWNARSALRAPPVLATSPEQITNLHRFAYNHPFLWTGWNVLARNPWTQSYIGGWLGGQAGSLVDRYFNLEGRGREVGHILGSMMGFRYSPWMSGHMMRERILGNYLLKGLWNQAGVNPRTAAITRQIMKNLYKWSPSIANALDANYRAMILGIGLREVLPHQLGEGRFVQSYLPMGALAYGLLGGRLSPTGLLANPYMPIALMAIPTLARAKMVTDIGGPDLFKALMIQGEQLRQIDPAAQRDLIRHMPELIEAATMIGRMPAEQRKAIFNAIPYLSTMLEVAPGAPNRGSELDMISAQAENPYYVPGVVP